MPDRSGREYYFDQVADELMRRSSAFFAATAGWTPLHGASDKPNSAPHFRDHLPFYEYFHGDSGRGMGASHQTG